MPFLKTVDQEEYPFLAMDAEEKDKIAEETLTGPNDQEEVPSFTLSLSWPLEFNILAECGRSKARTSKLLLPHYEVETPIFMPVGTQGTLKGITSRQLEEIDCQIILGNTYHLGMRPVSVCKCVNFIILI